MAKSWQKYPDRGTQYACLWFASLLEGTGKIIRSMSGKGNCFDNAVAESFFKTLKTELVYHNTYVTKEKAKESILGYIENFYNRHRTFRTGKFDNRRIS